MNVRVILIALGLLILVAGLLAVLLTQDSGTDQIHGNETKEPSVHQTHSTGPTEPSGKQEPSAPAKATAPELAPTIPAAASAHQPITGLVRDANGIPLADAFVRATGLRPRSKAPKEKYMRLFQVDANGGFSFVDLDPRYATFLVEGWKPGYCLVKHRAEPGERVELVLQHPGVLFGRVTVKGTGAPSAEAWVSVTTSSNTGRGRARTDKDGCYRIEGLIPGVYHATVTPRGGPSPLGQHTRVIVKAKQETETDFEVLPGLLVKGRVTDADSGVPIAGARVAPTLAGLTDEKNRVQTDAAGRYVLDGFPDRCRIRVQAEGYARFEAEVRSAEKEGREVVLDVRLLRAGTLAGRVVDPAGQGVPEARIFVVPGHPVGSHGKTDQEGAFCLEDLPVNAERRLVVRKKGFANRVTDAFTLRPGECRTGFQVRMSRGSTLSGRIRNEAGEPVTNAYLYLQHDDQLGIHHGGRPNVRPDTEGRYKITGLPAGRYSFQVLANGYIGRKRSGIVLGEDSVLENIDVVLDRGLTITGRVVDDEGRPVNKASVTAFQFSLVKGMATRSVYTRTDAQGRFTLSGVPAGSCSVCPRKQGFERLEESVGVMAGDQGVVLVLRCAARGIHGRVSRVDTGAPVQQFFVRCFCGHEARSWKFNDAEGRFQIEDLKPAEYHLEAGTDDGLISSGLVRVKLMPAGDSRQVDLTVGPGASLEGRVLAPDGSPLAGADVTVHRRNGPSGRVGTARTGRLGRFTMRGLVPGEHGVRAQHADWIESQETVAVVRGRVAEVEIRLLEKGGILEVVVKDGEGAPIADARVEIRRPDGSIVHPDSLFGHPDQAKSCKRFKALKKANPDLDYQTFRRAMYMTGSTGRVERHFLPPGRLRVEVRRAGYRIGRIEVEALAGARSGVDVILTPEKGR